MARIDTLLPLIGRLNYTWTNTESLLIYIIAHLMGTSKEAAIIVFLTLNTTRARLDLVERLAKMKTTSHAQRQSVLSIVNGMKLEAKIRNKYNHCIYSFDEHGELESTQLMRIAEFGDNLKYGKLEGLDNLEMDRIASAINKIAGINTQLWNYIKLHEIVI